MRSDSLPLPFLLAALALHLEAATATATAASPPSLFARDISCASGSKVCGQTCIPNSYTCCPLGDGGCPVDTVCQKGDNGLYGCCPTGQICEGDGGAQWVDGNTTASVSIVVGTPTATSTTALPDKTNGAARKGVSGSGSGRGSGLLGLLGVVVVMGVV